MLFQNAVSFRHASYKIFLIPHNLLAVFTVTSYWYRVFYWKGFTGVYELWIYMIFAVWFFDCLVSVKHIIKNSILRAVIVELASDIVRLNIHGVRWLAKLGYHNYTP
ncbi:Ferric/cupric reductase transmembrane component 1-like protein 1 [Colletotrichum truncatum]|uniref:Ferric/cupric reductase transmembrane component 1-like protein 1 n=1 Tax=Colletotrichum truncatum TaxID=5467 RepID=A0ACC3YYQ7_COLTU